MNLLAGIGALESVEAAYFTGMTDKTGKPFSGKNRYRLHFEKGALPPVDGSWSLSMYEVAPDRRAFSRIILSTAILSGTGPRV